MVRNRFFSISGETGFGIQKFFLKPSPDQYGANKRKSQIGRAAPEEIDFKQTIRQTSYYFVVLIVFEGEYRPDDITLKRTNFFFKYFKISKNEKVRTI